MEELHITTKSPIIYKRLYFWTITSQKEWSSVCIICLDIERPWEICLSSPELLSSVFLSLLHTKIHLDYKTKVYLIPFLIRSQKRCCSSSVSTLVFLLKFLMCFPASPGCFGFCKNFSLDIKSTGLAESQNL